MVSLKSLNFLSLRIDLGLKYGEVLSEFILLLSPDGEGLSVVSCATQN